MLQLLSDKELLSLDGAQEIEVLQKKYSALPKNDPLRTWFAPLAIRRVVARAQLAKVLDGKPMTKKSFRGFIRYLTGRREPR